MLDRVLLVVFTLSILLISGLYYKYALLNIPESIAKSDSTMMQTDAMRFTFKIGVLLQRSQATLTMAIKAQDEEILYDAIDYFEAANGFLYTDFIDNKKLIKRVEPYLNKIENLIESNGLELNEKQLKEIYEFTNIILRETEIQEKDIWINFQQEYVDFQTNEYTLQVLYQSITIFILLVSFLFLWIYIKQKKLQHTILKHEKELQDLAYYDTLTKVPNRRSIEQKIEQNIDYADRKERGFYLALIDIDNFKVINDIYGHDSGDEVLIESAKRIEKSIRSIDTVGRFGGDEFLIIFQDIEVVNDVVIILDRIIETFKKPVNTGTVEHYINVSIGVVHYPMNADNVSELIKYADIAMYNSKAQGKARYSFFESSQGDIIERQHKLELEIKEAFISKQFELYYQPQVNTNTKQVIGAEALVRWNHPNRGLVGPLEFIDIIENGYLVKEFGTWVIKEASAQQKRWKEQNIDVNISVNLSVKHILSQGFFEEITALVSELGIDLSKFHFEITEYNIMEYVAESSEVLNRLAENGFLFFLDDFGTGYSSITQLYNLKIDSLKIDKSFVDRIENSDEEKPFIEAIVNMSKALKLKIIAEGVETEVQYNYLKFLGCDTVQGYYFSKPLSVDGFENYIIQ